MTKEEAIDRLVYMITADEDLGRLFIPKDVEAIKAGIRALTEALNCRWIPITYRPATAEELEGTEYTEGNIFTCEMPEDGETVYISIYGETLTDTFRKDGFDSYFEDWGIEHVKAWHKKPEPYEAESEE